MNTKTTPPGADKILARIAELAATHRAHSAAAAARPRGKTARDRSRDGFSELHNRFAAEELEALLAEFGYAPSSNQLPKE